MLLWVFIRLSECRCVLMVLIGLYAFVWVLIGFYASLCVLTGLISRYAFLWVLMVPYRPYRS